jgi:adenosylmethionine-8-amino-7-oxononanoate aminotransferase
VSNSPIWRPYTQEATARKSTEVVRASGAYLYTRDGAKIFDGISSWWLITHGHCQPEIVEAIARQARKLDQITFANFSHEPADELASLLLEVTPPSLSKVFFSDNGSTAVEVALKMALQANAQSGHPEKNKFLTFDFSYHGDTVGAMSVSGVSPFNQPYNGVLFQVLRATQPTSSCASVDEFLKGFRELFTPEFGGCDHRAPNTRRRWHDHVADRSGARNCATVPRAFGLCHI